MKKEQAFYDETMTAVKHGEHWIDRSSGSYYFGYNGVIYTVNFYYEPKARHIHTYNVGEEPKPNKFKDFCGSVLDFFDRPKSWAVVKRGATETLPEKEEKYTGLRYLKLGLMSAKYAKRASR